MLRNRDILALMGMLILVRSVWDIGTDSLTATIDLAFFFPRESVMVLSPMDVDGDGSKEALATVKSVGQRESFTLEIMDLKPLHNFRKTYLEPFRPKVIFASEEINEGNAHPIHLTTGQLVIKKHQQILSRTGIEKGKKHHLSNDQEINDKTRHFFCGTDWHDASSKCKTPCPNGQASECPNDERCFADTPCDVLGEDAFDENETKKNMFELTPGGGLPSVASLWSNGVIIMHSLTNTKDETNKKRKPLELREMWRFSIFPEEKADIMANILWEEISVVFLDAYSSMEAHAQHGMVVINASYFLDGDTQSGRSTFTVAVDAFEGKKLWESHSDNGLDSADEKPLPLPMVERGQTSFARRRSSVARYMVGQNSIKPASALPNCMSLLRKAAKKEVFPYSYWGPKDAGVAAIHLNQRKPSRDNRNHRVAKPHEEHATDRNKHMTKNWRHRFHRRKHDSYNNQYGPIQGKPNALVTQTRGGLQIRSLKNGKPLCHLALLEKNLYSDLNSDGTLDQVQVALHTKTYPPNDKFIWNLAGKLHQQHQELIENSGEKEESVQAKPQLCHLLALSGIPPKEEMFAAPICGKAHERMIANQKIKLDSINPLVVESLDKRRKKYDIIVALNNGVIQRIHGSRGRRLWTLSGNQRTGNFPTWEEESNHNALLTRIQSNEVADPLRPLLLAGDDSFAVLSTSTGNILASVTFPQKSSSQPILADISGDGSTDVMILTRDGIWGYQIFIHRGYPVMQHILVGLLSITLMIATIRNRYSKGGKRSTDK